jgi:hypothetical protein
MYLRDQLVQLLKVCSLCMKKKITLKNLILFYTEAPTEENNSFVEAVATTTASNIHATSRKSARTAVTTWLYSCVSHMCV